ncbi:unnamed protein product [Rotaria sordida]|uniref:Uncharacterized protein n=1 Tax=Rotaria sordida TaxID=392033 RepID=A0A814L3Q4_9BILA|nr:unnamed protein product [Rotaria sordida]CAF1016526.1 unnamed protein product [Rotaria sordida]CAF1059500.1 unnamed protein product [Rotaria sordida]CAF3877725.1 unnamed protein product [Rotaria sordida]CAF4021018.1 unnamed protein product [Rotaria sordida]
MNYMKRSFYSTTASSSSSNIRDHLNNSSSTNKTTSSLNSCVRFNDLTPISKTFDEREKYLTAKYPQQQMQLIRKRLKVEFWLDDQLRFLYNIKDDSSQEDHDQCPEDLIDCLLDMDNESERRRFLIEKLKNVKQSRSITMEFIDEFLHRIKML